MAVAEQQLEGHRPGYAYRCYLRTILALLLYVTTLPLYSGYLSKLCPSIWNCPYQRITGEPCPLCGTTTAVWRLYKHGQVPEKRISFSLFILAFELMKKMALAIWDCGKRRTPRSLRWADILSTIAGISLVVYLLFFTTG